MAQTIVWALLSGGITGGVWVSIVLLGNLARLRKKQQALGVDVAARRAELVRLESRLAFVESRFALMDGVMQSEVPQRSGERTPLPDGVVRLEGLRGFGPLTRQRRFFSGGGSANHCVRLPEQAETTGGHRRLGRFASFGFCFCRNTAASVETIP